MGYCRKDGKGRITTILITFAILIFLVITAYASYKMIYEDDHSMRDMIQSRNFSAIYDFYAASNPVIGGRSYYGYENASITMVGYLDPSSDSSRFFINEIFPQIEEDFISTGKIRFYNKNYITEDDIKKRNERFIYSQSQLCFRKLNAEKLYNFYFGLFSIEAADVLGLADRYGVSKDELYRCMEEEEFEEIKQDIAETKTFRIAGDPRFYIGLMGRDNTVLEGVPSYERLRKEIKDYQAMIGDKE